MTKLQDKFIEQPLLGALVLFGILPLSFFISYMILILFFSWISDYLFLQIIYVIIVFISHIAFVFVITPYLLHLPNGKESFKEWAKTIGLSIYQPLKRNILLGILTFFVIVLCAWLFIILLAVYVFDPNVILGWPEPGNEGWFLFISQLLPGIWEEIVFRGLILTLLLKKYSEKNSIIISSILFGVVHLTNMLYGADVIETIVQVIYATFVGIGYGYMFVKTKSLLPCIISHYLVDSLGEIFLQATNFTLLGYLMATIIGFGVLAMIINIYLIKALTPSEEKSKIDN